MEEEKTKDDNLQQIIELELIWIHIDDILTFGHRTNILIENFKKENLMINKNFDILFGERTNILKAILFIKTMSNKLSIIYCVFIN
jgi:hypothetical protein